MFKRRGRLSLRDARLASKRALDFYADMAGKPRITGPDGPIPIIIAPKRERVKRPYDGQPVVPLEKEIQSAILEALELRSEVVFVGRFNRGQAVNTDGGVTRYTPFNTVKGFPDIHGLLLGGRAFYIEVKRPPPFYRKPDQDQQDFLDAARLAGACAGVACSVEEANALLPQDKHGE